MQATSSFNRPDKSAKKATRKPLIEFKMIRTHPPFRNSRFHPQYWISVESYTKTDDHQPLKPDSFTCHQAAECAHPSRRAMANPNIPVIVLHYKPPSANISADDPRGPPKPKQPPQRQRDEPVAKPIPNPNPNPHSLPSHNKNQLLQRTTTPADEPSQTLAVPTILHGPSSSPEQATKSAPKTLNRPHQLLRANSTHDPSPVLQHEDLVQHVEELQAPLSTQIIQSSTRSTRSTSHNFLSQSEATFPPIRTFVTTRQ
jgi:hypothetical protein